MTRRFVYYVAASADGFIARAHGSVDWLESRPAEDYGIEAFFASVDTIVWGRRTWDESLARGGIEPFGEAMRHIVLTHRPLVPQPRVEAIADPAALAKLRTQPGKDVWIMGGGRVAASLLDAGLLDVLDVHVIPVLLGSGVPLLGATKTDHALRLERSHAYADGVVRLTYAVDKAR